MSQAPFPFPPASPFSAEQGKAISQVLSGASADQVNWLSGYLAGVLAGGGNAAITAAPVATRATNSSSNQVAVIYATESGNAESLADQARKELAKKGFAAKIHELSTLEPADLAGLGTFAVIASTWGEGDPPERAVDFAGKLMAADAPQLKGCRYAVLALGDTIYEHFCKFGRDLDKRFAELGASRLQDLVEADVDFDQPYRNWMDGLLGKLQDAAGVAEVSAPVAVVADTAPVAAATVFDKKNPYPALLLDRVNLNGTGSGKETWHLELSIEGSGLSYEPGDSLGVYAVNCLQYVFELLRVCKLDGDETVRVGDIKTTLHEALYKHLDITTLSKVAISKHLEVSENPELEKLLASGASEYIHGRHLIDLFIDYPIRSLTGQVLVDMMRKMPARLYSICSSPRAHPGEVHLTVGALRYVSGGRHRKGVCSTFLADGLSLGETAPVYFHQNKHFRLPADGDTPIIMVGPGTGIAPFRAFVEDRIETGAKGKSWLFFGEQRFQTDFFYQLEWQDYLKSGQLTRMDIAFSRDTPRKVYVQHRMEEKGKDLFSWLEEGAYFYVCGDASRMAKDVADSLHRIVKEHGGMNDDGATDYIRALKKSKRLQLDVY